MSRVVRRILIVAAAVTGLLVVAAVALPFLIDVNRFRPLIAAQVKEVTGRAIGFGRISFTLLPAPGLSLSGPITVSDSAAYRGRNALSAESLSVRLSLPDLLRGRASITSFTLHKPTVTLIRDSRGRWNFDDLIARLSAPPQGRPKGAEATGGPGRLFVQQAGIVAGRLVVYDDAVVPGHRSQLVIAPVDATIRGWGGEAPTEFELTAGLGRSVLKAGGRILTRDRDPQMGLRVQGSGLRAEDFAALTPWIGVTRPAGLQLAGSMSLKGTADAPIEHPEALRFKGTLELDGVSYRDAGMALPVKDLSGKITVDGDRAVWKDFKVTAGSSSLSGSLQVEDFLRPRIGFALASPRVDLNQIVATLTPAGSAAATPSAAPPSTPASSDGASRLFDLVSGSGRLDVKELRFQTFDLANVRLPLSLSQGVFSLKDLTASFYGGSLAGSGSVDLSQTHPQYALAVRLDKVDMEPFLEAYDPSLKGLLHGRFTGNLDLDAAGAGMAGILKTARGTGRVLIADGVLTSFSVLKQLAALLEIAGGKGIGRESTPFERLTGTLALSDGRARTDDLALHSADLDMEGKGWVGLDATLDLDVVARFSEASTKGMVVKNSNLGALTENGRLVVYFGLTGALASPTFRLNTRATAGKVQERAKEKIRERLKDTILRRLGQPQPSPTPGP